MNNGPVIIETQSRTPRYKYFLAVAAILFLALVIVLTNFRVDKVIMEPGSAVSTQDSITISGVQVFDSKSDIRFLTVLVSANRPSLAVYLKARYIDRDSEIFDWKDINGDLTPQVSSELNRALMLASQGAASSVALQRLGCEVPRSGTGAIIREVTSGSPAQKAGLRMGDTITSINDVPVRLDSDVVDQVGKYAPGQSVQVAYEVGEERVAKRENIVLAEHPSEEKTSGFLGVVLATRDLKFKYPVDIKFDSGGVTGPSAGLAFTLQIIDQLSAGDLAGNNKIAVTGEIALDGFVNPVGGVRQKAIAASRAGAKLMIVPKGEGDTAKSAAGSMKVFEVSNLQDALDVLAANGGQELSQVQTCPSSE